MPTIYLKHPRHGTKVAIAESEAVADEKNGWERYDVAAPTVPAPVEMATVSNTLRVKRPYNKRAA